MFPFKLLTKDAQLPFPPPRIAYDQKELSCYRFRNRSIAISSEIHDAVFVVVLSYISGKLRAISTFLEYYIAFSFTREHARRHSFIRSHFNIGFRVK